MFRSLIYLLCLGFFASAFTLSAQTAEDALQLKGGGLLTGKLLSLDASAVSIETPYAGRLEIERKFIKAIRTVSEREWMLSNGTSLKGRAKFDDTEGWLILSQNGPRVVRLDAILGMRSPVAGSAPQPVVPPAAPLESPPALVVAETSDPGEASEREGTAAQKVFMSVLPDVVFERLIDPWNWSFEGSMNLAGRSGNTDKLNVGLRAEFEAKREQDRIELYGSYDYEKNGGRQRVGELIGGVQYTNFTFKRLGWFVRQDMERDEFEGIRFRSTTAGGMSYKWIDRETLKFEYRLGLGYRWENYLTDDSAGFPGLDFGVQVDWRFTDWGQFRSKWTFLPSINSNEDFIFEQDSGLNFPLAYSDKWKLRLGLKSQFNNTPDALRQQLDNSYYVRLLYSWD